VVEYKVNPVEHLGLVKSIALRYVRRNPSLALDDCISVGYEGLLKGCELFDPSRGVQPSTYLYKAIRSYIRDFHQASKKHRKTISLDSPISSGDEDGLTIESSIAAPSQNDNRLSSKFEALIAKLKKQLTAFQLEIFERRVMKTPPDTLQAIATDRNCSRENIRQNEKFMLIKLRKLAEEMQINDPT